MSKGSILEQCRLVATGKKAASDSSYHGGSRRGGYGHGLQPIS